MAARWSGIERDRYAESAALLCSAVLGALTLWLVVRLVWLLVPRSDAALDTVPARGAVATGGPVPAQSIAKWHLFGNTPLKPGQGANTPATTLSLILRGTIAENDPKTGLAVVSDPQNGERAFRVGDDVVPGAKLAGVYPDRIVLLHEGAEEVLKLPRDRNLAPVDVVRATPGSATSRGLGSRVGVPLGTSTPVASASAQASTDVKAPAGLQQTVEHLRQNPDELAKRVQVLPVLDGGKLTGVRLSAGADAALLGQIGLRAGDIVTSVNGTPVDSFARGQEIMASLKNSSSVRVTVLRDGKSTDLTVGLK